MTVLRAPAPGVALAAEAEQMTMQVAKQTEALILAELKRFLDQGSIVLIEGGRTFTRSPDGKLHFNQMVGLKLRDQEIIEALRSELRAAERSLHYWKEENEALWRVADAAQLIAYPRGFRDGNVPDDLHRALAALPKREGGTE